MLSQIDHLVYAVPDLEASLDWFEHNTGIRPRIGGRHPDRGTRNALLNLGDRRYLEIIAVDEDNHDVPPPRWMGVDDLDRPRMTRWCIAVPDLDAAAASMNDYDPGLGQRSEGSRRTPEGDLLRWRMLLPRPRPRTEIVPFCIDWSASERHPTDGLPRELELLDIRLYHPAPETVRPLLEQLLPGTNVYLAAAPLISVAVDTPRGALML